MEEKRVETKVSALFFCLGKPHSFLPDSGEAREREENMEKQKINRYEERRNFLRDNLLAMKKEGYRVFINHPDEFYSFNYGIVSDGKHIVYVQMSKYENLFETAYEYVPSPSYGGGYMTLEKGYGYRLLSKEVFDEVVKSGEKYTWERGIKEYSSIWEFMANPLKKAAYVEL